MQNFHQDAYSPWIKNLLLILHCYLNLWLESETKHLGPAKEPEDQSEGSPNSHSPMSRASRHTRRSAPSARSPARSSQRAGYVETSPGTSPESRNPSTSSWVANHLQVFEMPWVAPITRVYDVTTKMKHVRCKCREVELTFTFHCYWAGERFYHDIYLPRYSFYIFLYTITGNIRKCITYKWWYIEFSCQQQTSNHPPDSQFWHQLHWAGKSPGE